MMYLLLRDNKQSGPYSLDDLKTKGLKAYDLVWVEGKSAAWRYPSEVGELSAFAPAVEEQPFDRFYKKPAATAVASPTTFTAQPLYSEDPSPATRKRTIYVTMPGAAAAPVIVRETIREPIRPTRPAVAAPPIEDYAFSGPAANLLDNRDHTGELMPGSGRQHKTNVLQPVLIGVGVLVLLASGIFIGLSINKDKPGLPKLAAQTPQQLPVPPVVSPAATAPQAPSTNKVAATRNLDLSVSPSASNPVSPSATRGMAGKTGKTGAFRQKAVVLGGQALLPVTTTDSTTAGIAVVHREAVHRTEPAGNSDASGKEALRVSLASQVSVGSNKYQVGTFGGISNLQVTVSNKSAYPLDLVVVEVQYIQANKKTYKTENLYFHAVGPGMALMQEAPQSSRGIRVQYKITLINSKELGLSESGL